MIPGRSQSFSAWRTRGPSRGQFKHTLAVWVRYPPHGQVGPLATGRYKLTCLGRGMSIPPAIASPPPRLLKDFSSSLLTSPEQRFPVQLTLEKHLFPSPAKTNLFETYRQAGARINPNASPQRYVHWGCRWYRHSMSADQPKP